jgi:hypothetical protein
MRILRLVARGRRLNDSARQCPCCGRTFSGIFDLGYDAPDDWPHGARGDSDDLNVGEDRLTPDLCRIEGRYFIRCVLALPVRGADDALSFGPWAEVSHDTLHAYIDAMNGLGDFAPVEGILANALPGFEDQPGTTVVLTLHDTDQRPELTALDGPLADAQEAGISFDDLLDLYAQAGQDIRPHLAND